MIKAVIIDDELDAIKSIKLIIDKYCHDVQIIGEARSVIEGIKIIQNTKPDLVFLDIQMPQGDGFDLLESIPDKAFDVIFVTGYDQYAIKAIRHSAVDYLIKPVDIDEMINAVEKVKKNRGNSKADEGLLDSAINILKNALVGKIAITTLESTEYVKIEDIIRIQGEGSYSKIFIKDGRNIVVSKDLKEYEEQLQEDNFYRVHKSHLINISHVKSTSHRGGGIIILTDNSKIPVSRTKKDEFCNLLSRYTS